MTVPPPDGSRDRRIEDPTNLHLIHPAARRLLTPAIRLGVSANAVSVTGLLLGGAAAFAFSHWHSAAAMLLGLVLAVAWLIADGLDGMIARATGTASATGRILDGLCDHGVFVLIYVALALSIGTVEAWVLAVAAGAAHAVQSSLFEGERTRFHRRAKGVAAPAFTPSASRSPFVRLYDAVANSPDRLAAPFEARLANSADPLRDGTAYAAAAVPTMRAMSLLSANVRVLAITIACLLADPRLFWWFEIGPLSLLAISTLASHRRVERGFTTQSVPGDGRPVAF